MLESNRMLLLHCWRKKKPCRNLFTKLLGVEQNLKETSFFFTHSQIKRQGAATHYFIFIGPIWGQEKFWKIKQLEAGILPQSMSAYFFNSNVYLLNVKNAEQA